MSRGRYLQITFNFSGPTKVKELEVAFNQGLDWIRIAPNAWLVWTTSDPEKWFGRLKPKINNDDHMYIFEIDIDARKGWAPKSVWDWIKKTR